MDASQPLSENEQRELLLTQLDVEEDLARATEAFDLGVRAERLRLEVRQPIDLDKGVMHAGAAELGRGIRQIGRKIAQAALAGILEVRSAYKMPQGK
jgi:hypothetical protein